MEMPGNSCQERLLRKQLLLLATLVAGVAYLAGINPPGGVWQENGAAHKAGDTILMATNRRRFLAFYYCNATALAASIAAIFLLLLEKPRRGARLVSLRIIMVLDLLGLMGAYAAGSSRDFPLTLYTFILVFLLLVYVIIHIMLSHRSCCISPAAAPQPQPQEQLSQPQDEEEVRLTELKRKARRKLLMLLATFTAAITYVAGLSPSNGYWDRNNELGDHATAGAALSFRVKVRISVFLYLNAIAFTSSLWILVLLVTNKSWMPALLLHLLPTQAIVSRFLASAGIRSILPFMLILGTTGAYIARSYQSVSTTFYQLAFISLWMVILFVLCVFSTLSTAASNEPEEPVFQLGSNTIERNEEYSKVKSLILLLASLVATVTYQAGLHPPGGVWPDDLDGHQAGYPILLSTQRNRYKVFLYCNSCSFLLSMAAITMLLTAVKKQGKRHTTLLVSMILDMVALMGGYTAGNWRDASSSIYIVAMGCGVIIYVMIHLLYVITVLGTEGTRLMKKRHKRLLLVAILVATTAYQAGLNPPSGFWVIDNDNYPSRLWAFFYCNTVSFMATLALILFFISPNLYRRAVRCYALYGCLVLALLCLMAAYAAGTAERGQTAEDACVFVLLAMVVSVIVIHIIKSRAFLLEKEEEEENDEDGSSVRFGHPNMPRSTARPTHIPRPRLRLRSAVETKYHQLYARQKHSMLLIVLAASATYQQARLNQPGGSQQVLYDSNKKRYLAFFYINSTAFFASVFMVALQLFRQWELQPLELFGNMTLILDLLCIIAAYAAAVARGWEDAIALFLLVLSCVAIHAATWIQCTLYSWSEKLLGHLLQRPITEQS